MKRIEEKIPKNGPRMDSFISLFLAGDVMTGRGVDQLLPYPGDPTIHEPYIKNARGYVDLAGETKDSKERNDG